MTLFLVITMTSKNSKMKQDTAGNTKHVNFNILRNLKALGDLKVATADMLLWFHTTLNRQL
jgi:hypothetical protein